jgi:hypothetical protein
MALEYCRPGKRHLHHCSVRPNKFRVEGLYDHVLLSPTMQHGNARQRLPVSAIQAPFRFEWPSPKPSALRPGPNSTRRNGHNRWASFHYRFASFYSKVPLYSPSDYSTENHSRAYAAPVCSMAVPYRKATSSRLYRMNTSLASFCFCRSSQSSLSIACRSDWFVALFKSRQ